MRLISVFSLTTMSRGVAAGAMTLYQFLTSYSFKPISRSVGTFGSWTSRAAVVTARARILPEVR